jgi:hypothetical protein
MKLPPNPSCGAASGSSPQRELWVKTRKEKAPAGATGKSAAKTFLPPHPGLDSFGD